MSKLRSLLAKFTGPARPMAAEDKATQLRDMRAVALGALDEALVRAELEALGWPMLRSVILGAPGRSVEIDQVARAPGGVIVLETKTYSGHVDADLGSECWILSLRDRRSFVVPNQCLCTGVTIPVSTICQVSRQRSFEMAADVERHGVADRGPGEADGIVRTVPIGSLWSLRGS